MAYVATIQRRQNSARRAQSLGFIATAAAPIVAGSGPAAPFVAAAIGIASMGKLLGKAAGWPARKARASKQETEAEQRGVSYECIRQRDASWAAGIPFIPCQGPGDQQSLCAQAAANFGVRCTGDNYKCKTPAGPECTYERVGGPWPGQAAALPASSDATSNFVQTPTPTAAGGNYFQSTGAAPNDSPAWAPWLIGGGAGLALLMALR